MSDPAAGGGDGGRLPKTGDESRLADRLEALGDEIKTRRAEVEPSGPAEGRAGNRPEGLAMRLATEIVAAVLVGGVIGWFIDGWLGTSPWGLVVIGLLGFVAGILNAMRAAGLVKESGADRARKEN